MVADIDESLQHAVLYAAAVTKDGKTVLVDFVHEWKGENASREMLDTLPAMLAKTKPARFGWLPDGPMAAVAANLTPEATVGLAAWPPPGVELVPLKPGVLPQLGNGFAAAVSTGNLRHTGDPLLTAQAKEAEWAYRGNSRYLSRPQGKAVQAIQAAAGAVLLAKTVPIVTRIDPLSQIF